MKKWLFAVLLIPILLLLYVYVFIPSGPISSVAFVTSSTANGASRALLDVSKWQKWLPPFDSSSNSFQYRGYRYFISEKVYRGLNILITDRHDSLQSRIYILPLPSDSVALKWQCQLPEISNPFLKWQQYRKAIVIQKSMTEMLNRLAAFLEKPENVYNRSIESIAVQDTVFIATKTILKTYPSTASIYSLIQMLRDYTRSQGAAETGFPMLHVEPLDSAHFDVMAAIPVSKQLPTTSQFFTRKLAKINLLKARATGGQEAISHAFTDLRNYISDYHKINVAVPFESLVTERIKEPDSSKWITDIYFPILK